MTVAEFLKGTIDTLATDADEIMIPRAKFLRDQTDTNEAAFMSSSTNNSSNLQFRISAFEIGSHRGRHNL